MGEAVAVEKIPGPKLTCLQIGNESDRYGINFHCDPKTWGPEAFICEWLASAYAPIATIDGHYIAHLVSYVIRFASRFGGTQMIGPDFDPGPGECTNR